jgi:hypothetical protein
MPAQPQYVAMLAVARHGYAKRILEIRDIRAVLNQPAG